MSATKPGARRRGNTNTTHLTRVLAGVAESLDINPVLQQRVIDLYDDLSTWLTEQQAGVATVAVYPQGSFRLGTVVGPTGLGGQFDIDLVFLRDLAKTSITKAELKAQAGELLRDYCLARGFAEPVELGRCWRLEFFDDGFHLDVLPVIPDQECLAETGILLTDRDLSQWLPSNPIGFADWFYTRMNDVHIAESRAALAKQLDRSVEDVPVFLVRTPLQRAVQILKRHRDLYFEDRDADGPPSVLLTTLTGHAYGGQADIGEALLEIVQGIPDHVERRNGTWWVANPSHPPENFADKWNQDPTRKEDFEEWLSAVSSTLVDTASAPGIETAGNRAAASFGNEALDSANRLLGIAAPAGLEAAHHGGALAPHERSIEDCFPVRLDHTATVSCAILPATGWNRESRRALRRRRHRKHEQLEFRLDHTTLPEPYEIYWKVRNYGREAWVRGQLRGQIRRGARIHRESTLYAGEHYIDCYLVKDGICRARTRFWVPITR